MMPRHQLLAVTMVACMLFGCGAQPADEPNHAMASAAVTVAQPVKGQMPRTVVGWGQISAGAFYQQGVAFPSEGALVALNVAQGEHVAKGQSLGRFALSAAAKVAAEQARTSLQTAKLSLARLQRLRAGQLATDEQVSLAEKAVSDAQAEVASYPVSVITQDTILKAPVDGTVTTIIAQVGAVVPAGSALLVITPSSRLDLAIGVEPKLASLIQPGMHVMSTPADGGDAVAGTVVAVGDAVDGQTHLVPVRISQEHPSMAGSSWRAEITVGEATGWVVPTEAVIDDGDRHYVFQVRKGAAHRAAVEVLDQRGDAMVVSGDLDAQLPLVTAGAPQLTDGMAVATNQGRK